MSKRRMKMGNVVAVAICLAAATVTFIACNKDEVGKNEVKKDVLNITAINRNSSEIVTRQLISKEKKSFPIDCYVLSTAIFDTRNNSYGYADCNIGSDSLHLNQNIIYRFMDIETGVEIKQIPLPATLSLIVLDTTRNLLIGHYYEQGKDYIISIDLNNRNVVSDKQLYGDGFWNSSVHFFREVENEYVLLNSDNELVFINPSTGNIIRTLSIEMGINNVVYDRKNNRCIGTTNIAGKGENYIVTIDLNTGNTLSKVIGEGMGSAFAFLSDEMDYDAETNSYILVSANNEVLFFDVSTGKIKERYQLDFNISSLKLWRSRE